MDLCDLPSELIENIAVFLSFEDLCSCSKVNAQWKIAFNFNRVWKRFCSFHPNYFDKQVSKCINYPVTEDCKSKIQALNESYVRSNHLSGNFHTLEVECGSLYCDNALDFVDDVGNHWLFLSCMDGLLFESEHYILVWNMNNDAYLHSHTKTPLGIIERIYLSEMKMNKDKLCFVYEDTALTYQFAYPVYELKLISKVVLKSETPPDIAEDIKIVTVGDFIVGCIHSNDHIQRKLTPLVHVWNVDGVLICSTQKTLQGLDLEDMAYLISSPVCHVKTNNIDKVMIATKYEQFYFTVMLFDVSSFQFTEFFVHNLNKQLSSQDICGNIVSLCIFCSEERKNVYIQCYTVENCKEFVRIMLNHRRQDTFHALIEGSDVVELMVLKGRTFYICNLSTKKQSFMFKLLRGRQFAVKILNNVLMMLKYVDGRNIYNEVWDFKSGSVLYRLDCSTSLGLNQYSYSFICMTNYVFPPKIIAFRDPLMVYPRGTTSNKFIILSFW